MALGLCPLSTSARSSSFTFLFPFASIEPFSSRLSRFRRPKPLPFSSWEDRRSSQSRSRCKSILCMLNSVVRFVASEARSAKQKANQAVVGWPPVRAFLLNSLVNLSKAEPDNDIPRKANQKGRGIGFSNGQSCQGPGEEPPQ